MRIVASKDGNQININAYFSDGTTASALGVDDEVLQAVYDGLKSGNLPPEEKVKEMLGMGALETVKAVVAKSQQKKSPPAVEPSFQPSTAGGEPSEEAAEAAVRDIEGIITVEGNSVCWNGHIIGGTLGELIYRLRRNKKKFSHLAKFFGKLNENPNRESANQLYEYVMKYNFEILPNGNFLAWKGVKNHPDNLSVNSGTAWVNGERVSGHIPNKLHSVIEMPRDNVSANRHEGCSRGLHAGAWEYARGWGAKMIVVEIDPADVVSVPSDSGCQKLRTCKYVVRRVVEDAPKDKNDEPDLYDEDEDYEETQQWDEDDDDDYDEDDDW